MFGSEKIISYIYDASGSKIQKKVTVAGVSQTTEYLDGFQYASTNVINGGMVMDFFPTAEGYVKLTEGKRGMVYNYVYNYTDHLGNVRLSYGLDSGGALKILEENNYYPFGLKHRNYNMTQFVYERDGHGGVDLFPCSGCSRGYQYKYNGKEFQDELGLNLYDYGARNYDPAIGRWMNIDPEAGQREWLSPYNYVQNNPVVRIDPDGRLDDWVEEDGNYFWDDRVTDSATAEQYHGTDANYVGKAAIVSSKQGDKTLDSVSLNSDGSVTKDGVTLGTDSNLRFSNVAGLSFQSRQTEGQYIGISANFAFLGGLGISLGHVSDAVGNGSFYFTFNANIGLGLDATLDIGKTNPYGSNQFLTSDFEGEGSSYNVGFNTPLGSPGWTTGGSVNPKWNSNDKIFSPSKWGTNDRGYKVEQAGFGLPSGWGGGATYSQGTTTLLD